MLENDSQSKIKLKSNFSPSCERGHKKPKCIFKAKTDLQQEILPREGNKHRHMFQGRAGCRHQGLGRAELLSQGTGTRWWNMPRTCPESPFATLSYQASLFIHANGAEGKINVKAKELNMKQHIPLVLFLYPTRPISCNLMKSCFSTQALL